jgi:hypothetical protein
MERSIYLFIVVAMSASLFVAGCTIGTSEKPVKASAAAKPETPETADDAEIRANLAQLTPENRKLAEAQKWCAVDGESPLGSMDVPYKLMVKGEPVFLCCEGCKKKALADPDKSLAKVAALKIQAGGSVK